MRKVQPRRQLKVSEPYPAYRAGLAEMLRPAQTLADMHRDYRQPEGLASDSACSMGATFGDLGTFGTALATQVFIGYPACSNLAQYGLMQAGVGILADETTRKWPEFAGPSDGQATDAAKAMNAEMDRLNVRSLFREMARMCGFFGGGLLYMDFGDPQSELEKPIAPTRYFVKPGSLRCLVPVEPINVGPLEYNSTNPLREDYFKVSKWFVSGVGPVHASRFLHFAKTVPPMILRPSYNFFGVPDVQLALDYFLHFTETRESAARLLKKFSLTVIKTNVDALLYGSDDSDVRNRIAHLAQERDNDGVYAISQEDEDIVQINTPLGGVTDIVRQALELLACVWRYPVVKFLGVSPGGMNATGESDLRSFYDHVSTQRQAMFAHNFDRLFKVMQLSLFGDLREDLTYTWPSLWDMTEKEQTELEKLKADTDAILLDRGVVSPEEVRSALATDRDGRFAGIDPEEVPEAPDTFPAPAAEEEEEQDKAGEVYA